MSSEGLGEFEDDVLMYARKLGDGEMVRFREIRDVLGDEFGMYLRVNSDRDDPYLKTSPRGFNHAYKKTSAKPNKDYSEEVVSNALSFQELDIDPKNKGVDDLLVVYESVLEEEEDEEKDDWFLDRTFQ